MTRLRWPKRARAAVEGTGGRPDVAVACVTELAVDGCPNGRARDASVHIGVPAADECGRYRRTVRRHRPARGREGEEWRCRRHDGHG